MNWFGGDNSKKEEKKKAKQQKEEEDLAVRQAQHARNQRIKHLSGAPGGGTQPDSSMATGNSAGYNQDVVMREEIG